MSKPTNDEIETMAARGWTWDQEIRAFVALGARDSRGCPIVGLRVRWWGQADWVASYGVPGIDYSPYVKHATPMEAADEAEAWLRSVLLPFRFPWLGVGEGR